MIRRACGLFAASLALAACASAPAADDPGALERGAAVVAPFKQRLLGELTRALAAGGPEHALGVCRMRAPALASEASAGGARVGRTSHKLRNPANAAPRWAAPLLAELVAGESAPRPRAVRLERGRVGYAEPIFTAPLCLACHGDAIEPAVSARLRELYPDDRATGFRAGELRGIVWAELPAPESR